MSTTWTALKQSGKPKADPCCAHECTSGTRNRYFTGKRLTPDALLVEQTYALERRRLLNRAMHGWGVVYGYPATIATGQECGEQASGGKPSGKLAVGAGLALDRMGRELLQTDELVLSLDDMLELGSEPTSECGTGDCWMLRVHYAEQLGAPLSAKDPCNQERQQWDHVCETVRYSLQRVDCATCCDDKGCGLSCGCATGPCCGGQDGAAGTAEAAGAPRSGAASCMCESLTALAPGARCASLTEVADGVRCDLANGVPLACLTLGKDDCGEWTFTAVSDASGPRRLVKRNDLLFDLIRGCDLTYISKVGWAAWLDARSPIPWDDFEKFFDAQETKGGLCGSKFTVEFSRPVRKATVMPECFAMTFLIRQREGGWLLPMRAPILGIEYGEESGANADLVRRATLVFKWGWVKDAVRGEETEFDGNRIPVEIEIRGDLILDCNGQALDANARGRSAARSGNGTPGGTSLSHFEVYKKPAPRRSDTADDTSIANGGSQS